MMVVKNYSHPFKLIFDAVETLNVELHSSNNIIEYGYQISINLFIVFNNLKFLFRFGVLM